ncbi:hypothetical protein MKW98_009211, partial [Papaver atlanticum]
HLQFQLGLLFKVRFTDFYLMVKKLQDKILRSFLELEKALVMMVTSSPLVMEFAWTELVVVN